MKRIAIFALILSMIVLPVSGIVAFAEPFVEIWLDIVPGAMPEVNPIMPRYAPVTGTVREILTSDRTADAEQRFIVDGDNGQECVFVLSKDTFWASSAKTVAAGDRVTGFYDTSRAMIMIYPPQYTIEIIAVNINEGLAVTVDRFDNELKSSDGKLQLKIGEHTQVLTQDGNLFLDQSGFAGRLLVVLHNSAEYPLENGRTAAWEIYVMYEKALPVPMVDDSDMSIVINGRAIAAPKAYRKNDVIMVPLRAIAETLGFKVQWEPITKSIMLNNSISLSIGKDYYTFARMAPISLGTAPELKNGSTFVPLSFFTEVARVGDALLLENITVADNS